MPRPVVILLGLVIVLAGIVGWCVFSPVDIPLQKSLESTSLPLKTNEWKEIKVDDGYNSNTYVLELQHGWLVFRQNGFGGGMAFVPKLELK